MSDLTFSCAGSDADAAPPLGTLMWIGDFKSPEFGEAYQHCLAQVAQFALRRNFDDALCRPAAQVRCILIAQATRRPLDRRCLELLREAYPEASFLNLQGTLCEGMREPADAVFDGNRHYWHRWNQVLPDWLSRCGVAHDSLTRLNCRSVAVLTSSFGAGEPLMELAESAGATAVWCRRPDAHRVRNVDAVWWDDTVASPTSSDRWRERIAAFGGSGTRTAHHAWIVNAPRLEAQRQAIDGGIDLVVSKPHRIDCLLATLASQSDADDCSLPAVSRAA